MQGMPALKVVLVIGVALGVVFPCAFSSEPANATSSEPSVAVLANNDHSTQDTNADFAFLTGRWHRPDGGYVIDIKAVEASGKVDAAYYNPNPIHVSKAEATREGSATNLFVELRDTGYPGCTYTLTYDPQTDHLRGVYFQAAIQQNFEVVFFRIK